MIPYNTAIVLAGTSLLGASSGLIGTFALLRRRALLGDTLAHAALPGLCVGFLVWRERNLPIMLAGALGSGVAGIAVVAALRRFTRIKDDAALGIVLSLFFGAGLGLLRYIQTHAVGGSRAGLDHYIFGSAAGMIASDVKLIGAVTAVGLATVVLLYKEFRLVTFDAAFARVQGWPASLLDFLIMLLVSVMVIVALPAAGVVLTAALLILPAVAARFWTDWLGAMLILSATFGALIGAAGTLISTGGGMPTGPMIVLAGAVMFLIAMLFAPRRGVVARTFASRRATKRLGQQKLLRALYELVEPSFRDHPGVATRALAERMSIPPARLHSFLRGARRTGLISTQPNQEIGLTDRGLQRAARIVRATRLWRLFLTQYPDSALLFSDLDVEQIDQILSSEMVNELENKLRQDGVVSAS